MNALSILVDGLGMGILMNTLPISASTCGLSLPEGALLQSSGEHFVSNFVGGPVQFSMTCPDNDMIVTFRPLNITAPHSISS